jgi:hypothetical protein
VAGGCRGARQGGHGVHARLGGASGGTAGLVFSLPRRPPPGEAVPADTGPRRYLRKASNLNAKNTCMQGACAGAGAGTGTRKGAPTHDSDQAGQKARGPQAARTCSTPALGPKPPQGSGWRAAPPPAAAPRRRPSQRRPPRRSSLWRGSPGVGGGGGACRRPHGVQAPCGPRARPMRARYGPMRDQARAHAGREGRQPRVPRPVGACPAPLGARAGAPPPHAHTRTHTHTHTHTAPLR